MGKEYVLIEKTGSSGDNYIRSATLTISLFHLRFVERHSSTKAVKETMKKIIELDDMNADATLIAITTIRGYGKKEKYRYQAVFDIVHY